MSLIMYFCIVLNFVHYEMILVVRFEFVRKTFPFTNIVHFKTIRSISISWYYNGITEILLVEYILFLDEKTCITSEMSRGGALVSSAHIMHLEYVCISWWSHVVSLLKFNYSSLFFKLFRDIVYHYSTFCIFKCIT